MLQNEDVVSICLSNLEDKSRGYSHLTLDEDLKKLFLVKEDNMKLEVETEDGSTGWRPVYTDGSLLGQGVQV